ncbi:hypothetical protein ACIQWR_37510 [Streptomyces sp. NPDC098789]|uniref:hypothetical protein n=1 Tax=Streptomyces sp. NPDC098789 TaxID=3366098 RepID=UPI00380E5D4B
MWTAADRDDLDWLWRRLWSGEQEILAPLDALLQGTATLRDELPAGETPRTDRAEEVFSALRTMWGALLTGVEELSGIVGAEPSAEREQHATQYLVYLDGLRVSVEESAVLFHDLLGDVVEASRDLDGALTKAMDEGNGPACGVPAGFGDEAARVDLFERYYDWLGPESVAVVREVLTGLRDRTQLPDPSHPYEDGSVTDTGAGPVPYQAYERPESVRFKAADPDGLPLHDHYRNEELGQHWRQRESDRTALSTLYVDLDERAAYRATIRDGAVVLADDSLLAPGSTRGWVLADDQLYVFNEFSARFHDASGRFVETRVISSINEVRPHINAGGHVKLSHHSTAVAGAHVTAAGMLTVNHAGKLSLDNWSGHYRPEAANMGVAVAALVDHHGLDPNTDVVLRGENDPGARAIPGLEDIHTMHEHVRATRDGAEYPYDKGDVHIPASVLAQLGENADATSIRLHGRTVAQIERDALFGPSVPAPQARTSSTTTTTTATPPPTTTTTTTTASGPAPGGGSKTAYEEDGSMDTAKTPTPETATGPVRGGRSKTAYEGDSGSGSDSGSDSDSDD